MTGSVFRYTWSCLFFTSIFHYSAGCYSECLDVAIIGGGIGGIYTAYRLRKTERKIAIFEILDRIGGRIYTSEIPNAPGANVEFGAMRFVPDMHPNLANLIHEAGLTIADFPLNFGNPNETLLYLRGRHLKPDELGGPRTPYDLRPEERLPVEDLLRKLYTENTNISRVKRPEEDEIYAIYTSDGDPLYNISLNEFLGRYASKEAREYIRDLIPYADGLHGAHTVLDEHVFPKNPIKSVNTIQGGFIRLPTTLLHQFLETSKRHSLHLKHQLLSIKEGSGGYRLHFAASRKDQEYFKKLVCARKVVLALQRDSIARIDFPPFQDSYFRQHLNSVSDFPAGKVFLAYQTPWWKAGNENITYVKSDLQTTYTYDWGTGSNGFVVHLPVYCIGDRNVVLWRHLQKSQDPISGSLQGDQTVTEEITKMIHSFMSRFYRIPESEIPKPVGGGMQLWDTFPFQGARQLWKPGFRMEETQKYLLKPFHKHDIFIVGNSWARTKFQVFSEGTLLSVNQLLRLHNV